MKYEYLTERFEGIAANLQDWLNERGEQGWQLVTKIAEDSAEQRTGATIYTVQFVFMREQKPEVDVEFRGGVGMFTGNVAKVVEQHLTDAISKHKLDL